MMYGIGVRIFLVAGTVLAELSPLYSQNIVGQIRGFVLDDVGQYVNGVTVYYSKTPTFEARNGRRGQGMFEGLVRKPDDPNASGQLTFKLTARLPFHRFLIVAITLCALRYPGVDI